MKRETLENLGLEVQRIERDINHCDGLGSAYLAEAIRREEPEDNQNYEEANENQRDLMLMASATNYRRAAAHSLLLGNLNKSQNFFQKAGEAYARQKLPYALMMNLFNIHLRNGNNLNRYIFINGERYIFRDISFEEAENLPHKLQFVYVLLSIILPPIRFIDDYPPVVRYLSPDELENIREKLGFYRNQPIGILGIPLGNYLDVYDAIYQNLDLSNNNNLNNQISLEEAVFPFLNSYNNAIRLARQNSYHWKRLAMPFHPAEPDIFSILLIIGTVMKRRQQSIFSTIERIPLQQQTNIFLNGILRTLLPERY